MPRRELGFQTIHSEGGLLPADLLRRVIDPNGKLDGTAPGDYSLPEGDRLNESVTESWNRLGKHWNAFRSAASQLADGEAGTGITNDKWTLPLLRELGFGLLPTTAGPEINGRTYAISRFFGPVAIHLVGCGLSLDRRAAGQRGAAAVNPHGLVQEFLNRSEGHLWAIASNGLRLRILRDSQTLSRQSYLEFDLEGMFNGEIYSDFVLLWLVAHATRFAPREGDRVETCWLEQWTKEAEEQGTRALGDLRGGVERALQILGEGFTGHRKNVRLRDALRSGQLSLSDFHGQLLRVVYRLIFLFVAEDRLLDGQPLLHPPDDSERGREARDRYAAHYSTARLRELAGRIKGSRHGDLWRQVQPLVRALSGEETATTIREALALPALGSFLWDPGTTTAINDAEVSNYDLLEALRHLAYTRQGKVLRPVDYRNLGAEELGGVYESLLALTPQISADGARFGFAEFSGNERKTSGSYYTPDSLVQCLLDSALDPMVGDALRGKAGTDAEKAILDLKVCDPAVGSGHFLVGAAHRLARHLARVRAEAKGESEPSPAIYQGALRDVIGRCLYGVDINPMAAELCRVSLWLEALEPGKPLSFLDHHIRVGNSLLGTTPELIAEGIPDQAFAPIEGDDRKSCSSLKRRNEQEREGGQGDFYAQMVAEPNAEYRTFAPGITEIDAQPDGTLADVHRKVELFGRFVASPEYSHARLVADAWASAFVWIKSKDMSPEPITTNTLSRLREDPEALLPAQATTLESLAARYQFFHWHLAFPEVLEKGGFDCILGNPPYLFLSGKGSPVKALQRAGDVAGADRLRRTFALCRWVYAETSRGCQDYFKWFAHLATRISRKPAHIGLILPNSWISLPRYADVRALLIQHGLSEVLDFGFGAFPELTVATCATTVAPTTSGIRYADLRDSMQPELNPGALRSLSAASAVYIEPTQRGDLGLYRHPAAVLFFDRAADHLRSVCIVSEGDHNIDSHAVSPACDRDGASVAVIMDWELQRFRSPGVQHVSVAEGYRCSPSNHVGPRVILRKTGDQLVSAVSPTHDQAITHQNAYVIRPVGGLTEHCLQALLGSRMLTFLYRASPLGQKGRTMAQLRVAGLYALPLPPRESLRAHTDTLEEFSQRLHEERALEVWQQLNGIVYGLYGVSPEGRRAIDEWCCDVTVGGD